MTLVPIQWFPTKAMVLAAGLGKRMRPLTDKMPKPMISVAGKPLIDHALARVNEASIPTAVVNVHYLADQIEDHLKTIHKPEIIISDEREELLETAGGIKKALPLLGDHPFLIFNSDSLWIEKDPGDKMTTMQRLIKAWMPDNMDILLLLVERENAFGFDGPGDYFQDHHGLLTRRSYAATAPYVYAGVSIAKPELFKNLHSGSVSLNEIFDKIQSKKRLSGVLLHGHWLHVGTPEAIGPAEDLIRRSTINNAF